MQNKVVSREDWVKARKSFLKREKEFTRMRESLARERRELPWEKVEKEYRFQTPEGTKTLAQLFDGRSQLLTYHFMLGPDWEEGCKGCSFIADHFEGPMIHLPHRDVTLLAVSRAPLEQIARYQARMGWKFRWVSSFGSDFNYDYHVSFAPEAQERKQVHYNYREIDFPSSEGPGISAFIRDDQGGIFHTYSSYARGLESLIGTYEYLDIAPKGRDEETFAPSRMAWVKHHDKYPNASGR